jgi:hypothetical protein
MPYTFMKQDFPTGKHFATFTMQTTPKEKTGM